MRSQSHTCKTCNAPFAPTKAQLKRGHGIYCSFKCRGIDKRARPNVTCGICNKPFHVSPWRLRLGRGKFCSSKCYGDSKRTKEGHIDQRGYRMWSYTHHPLANKGNHVYEHWLVMYDEDPEFTMRAKEQRWTIHHKNGVRDDNRPENLEWRAPGRHPQGWSLYEMIDALKLAGYEVTRV